MKKISLIALIIAILITIATVLYFRINDNNKLNDANPNVNKSETGLYKNNKANNDDSDEQKIVKLSPNITLFPEESLLDILSENIDFDDDEEQILITRNSKTSLDEISIIVADFSPQTKQWFRLWETTTIVTKIKTFQLYIDDPIGDHNYSIICYGMNSKNEQTLTIFKRNTDYDKPEDGEFIKIFEQAGTSIELHEEERTYSYKLVQANSLSWPVYVWKMDTSSSNILDQIKEKWDWNFQEKQYTLTSVEQIEGRKIEQELTQTILNGNADDFKNFLIGTWYKSNIDPLSKNAQFITFDLEDDSILFSGDNIIEIYDWESSNSTRLGIYASTRNRSVNNLKRLMDLELSSVDSIKVRVFQNYKVRADISGIWDGYYKKLSDDLASSFKKPISMAVTSKNAFDGLYNNEELTLEIYQNTYKLSQNNILESGILSTYILNKVQIIDMVRSSDNERKSWIAELVKSVNKDETPTESIKLTPITISIEGIVKTQGDILLLERRSEFK